MRCGFCDVVHSVVMSADTSYSAMAARGSIAFGMSRLLTTSISTTWSAFANAASTGSFSPRCQSKQRLLSRSSWTFAAPSATAAPMFATASSGS